MDDAIRIQPLDDAALARLCKALSHPARVAIARDLAAQTSACTEIVRRLPLAQSTVSQHLKIMREAGILAGSAPAGLNGGRCCYGLDRAALIRLAATLGALAAVAATASARAAAAPEPDAIPVVALAAGGRDGG
jgi:ArsR family transcriptional regulator